MLVAEALRAWRAWRLPARNQDALIVAARAEGYTWDQITEWTGLSRQGANDAFARAHRQGEGATLDMWVAHPHLAAAMHAAEIAGVDVGCQPSELCGGRVRYHDGSWLAEVGSGSTLRTLSGRHATITAAVLAVLTELQARKAELRESLGSDPATAILARLV